MLRSVTLVLVLFFGLASHAMENFTPFEAFDLKSRAQRAMNAGAIREARANQTYKTEYFAAFNEIKKDPKIYYEKMIFLKGVHPPAKHIFNSINEHVAWTFAKKVGIDKVQAEFGKLLANPRLTETEKQKIRERSNKMFREEFAKLSKEEKIAIFNSAVSEAIECFEKLFMSANL